MNAVRSKQGPMFSGKLLSIAGVVIMIMLTVIGYFARGVIEQVSKTNDSLIELNNSVIINTQALQAKTIKDKEQDDKITSIEKDVKDHDKRITLVEAKK